MTPRTAFRGQPLLVLVLVLGSWLVLRGALWAPPFERVPLIEKWIGGVGMPLAARNTPAMPASIVPRVWRRLESGPLALAASARTQSLLRRFPAPEIGFTAPAPGWGRAIDGAIGHNLLLFAGLGQMRVPAAIASQLGAPSGSGERDAGWSLDGWLLARQGSAAPLLAAQPSYGRSQAGAVLRYQLAPASTHRPQAHLRASTALAGPRERELAAGLSARPLPGVPLRAVVEARVSDSRGGTYLRPAAYAVTELPPQALPLGAWGEAYLQAGYVGGEGASPFVDGQARIERAIERLGDAEFSAGAGAWGGAQKGAARLDIGPTASVGFPLGEGRGRIAADYRVRVAGDAAPASGAALTLSAGF